MYGIQPVAGNDYHAGPVWAYNLPTQTFIPPTVQPDNVGNKPPGTYKVDPMQGGGTGFQEPGFLVNHMSDYSVFKMRDYLHSHVLVWNESLNSYASWNQTTGGYTNTVTNNGVQFPLERDAQVISVMASISGAKPDVNMVYPPIGPYTTGLIHDWGRSSDFAFGFQTFETWGLLPIVHASEIQNNERQAWVVYDDCLFADFRVYVFWDTSI